MNNRISTTQIVLIVLLVLVLTGTISLGSILKGVVFVVLGIIAFVIIMGLLFRRRLRKMAGQAQQQSEQYGRSQKREGEVTIEGRAAREKEVNPSVGEYVEFEEIEQ